MNKASTRPARSEPNVAAVPARPTAPRPVSARATAAAIRELPLRVATEEALGNYFASLEGHRPGRLYDLVLREVEEPLFSGVPKETQMRPIIARRLTESLEKDRLEEENWER